MCYVKIGIINSDLIKKGAPYSKMKYYYEGYTGFRSNRSPMMIPSPPPYGPKLKKGDIIQVICDMYQLQISYCVNGKHLGVAYSIVGGADYCLCVQLRYNETQVQILDIERHCN